jgi:speckle-type POZ protein
MLKTQRFSSLFRHYAKYHGLRKDDLEYYFCNILENEDTPESVQLQRGDTIMVRKRRPPPLPEAAADDDEFFKDMRDLLEDEEHMDAIFLVHPPSSTSNKPQKRSAIKKEEEDTSGEPMEEEMIEIRAHKCILTARAEYFKALFRTSQKSEGAAFRESEECTVRVEPTFTEQHIRWVLDFIYTNRVRDIRQISTDDLLYLLHLGDKWLLRDMKRLVEHELIRAHMAVNTVARLYGATEEFGAKRLSRACIEFIMSNLRQLAGNAAFEDEMKQYPHLCIPVLKAAADLIPEGPLHKKQRTDHSHHHRGTPTADPAGSSPVPDSDT